MTQSWTALMSASGPSEVMDDPGEAEVIAWSWGEELVAGLPPSMAMGLAPLS